MAKAKISVKWDFSGTELEDLQYEEALDMSDLKKSYIIEDYDEEDVEVEDYLLQISSGIYPKTYKLKVVED